MLFNYLWYIIIGKLFFVFKHTAAYDKRISDWSLDVCSSYLRQVVNPLCGLLPRAEHVEDRDDRRGEDDRHPAVKLPDPRTPVHIALLIIILSVIPAKAGISTLRPKLPAGSQPSPG